MRILPVVGSNPFDRRTGRFPLLYCPFDRSFLAAVAYDDLVDAVVAAVNARLVAAGVLNWFGTGCAPPESSAPLVLPYGQLAEPDEDDQPWNTAGDQEADGHLEIACYASTKKAARRLGDRVAAALAQAYAAGELTFAAGVLFYFNQSGRTGGLDPDPSPGGGDCWSETRQFHFRYTFNPYTGA